MVNIDFSAINTTTCNYTTDTTNHFNHFLSFTYNDKTTFSFW